MDNQLNYIIAIRKNGQLEKANALILKLVEKEPDNALYHYHCAWIYDSLGKETEAIPHYEKAIHIGLEREDLEGAYLGLGSTYRTLGNYEQSKRVFQQAMEEFPQAEHIKVFHAMTLYNLGEFSKAMETLLNSLILTTNDEGIQQYSKAIQFYSDKLDQTWA
ncbi:tetratricopeptide repeat protein [Lysinibacillus sphaericus]|uniref:tetratricopeptide repeat protein n=1 Tax=Lysinibacillus sphaericus TaxID=1421 RepID=UPI003D07D775